jgi:hypothetical protein
MKIYVSHYHALGIRMHKELGWIVKGRINEKDMTMIWIVVLGYCDFLPVATHDHIPNCKTKIQSADFYGRFIREN